MSRKRLHIALVYNTFQDTVPENPHDRGGMADLRSMVRRQARGLRKAGFQVLPDTALAKAGDFVTFDFSHIGLVIEDQPTLTAKVKTVEGNTNGKGERDSTSGDGVWLKERDHTLTKAYIRIFTS